MIPFVRAAVPEDRLEEFWIRISAFDPSGTDESNLPNGDLELLVYFPSEAEAHACAAALRVFGAAVESRAPAEWNAAWQAGWEPVAVGRRFWIGPPGVPPPPDRIPLFYHPGLAFGNGDHPTTQLCLELMERLVQPGDRLLDLGCASGLLCQAAAALGARAFGCDLDTAALLQARHHRLTVFRGSIDAVGAVDLVVANLARGTLEALWPEIRRAARRTVIASGLLATQRDTLAGFDPVLERDGWLAGAISF